MFKRICLIATKGTSRVTRNTYIIQQNTSGIYIMAVSYTHLMLPTSSEV